MSDKRPHEHGMRRPDPSLLFAAMSLLGGSYLPCEPARRETKKKRCVNCDELHEHNNSFCSAKCCKEYRGKNG